MNHAQNRSDGATRPEDQLYQEFESYVQSLYTEASERPLKRLENSIGQVVEKLEAGVRKAMATVDDRSGRLEKLFDQTRREFQTQFGPVLEDYRREQSAYYATSELWDDGILDPIDTRNALGLCLSASLNAPIDDPHYGVFRL